jgi:prepilin-type N-terminal cleavage/methylation domain-containing protein
MPFSLNRFHLFLEKNIPMNSMKLFYRQGFTLMELLIVLAIVVALFAILLPALLSSQLKSRIQQANIQIKQLEGYLEQYATENRGYPTTEQGLYALIYFSDNQVAAMTSPTLAQPSGMTPGMDPNAAFSGNAVAVGGADVFGSPTGTPIGPPMGTPNPMGVGSPVMDTNSMGTANPMPGTMGSSTGITANPMDSMSGMMSANPMGTMGGTMATMWNQPFHNPQIYTLQRKRPTPYIDSDKSLIDPWGQPYRYDNSMQYNGLNKTGEAKPAIWSSGPDKRDGTEDDILGWDPNEAQRRIAQQQQLQQFQGGMGTTNPMDSMNMMGNSMGNLMDPSGTGMMNQPMNPAGMPNQPGMASPRTPSGAGMMNQPTVPAGMPNQPGMSNPMPTPPTPTPPTSTPAPMPTTTPTM